MPLTELGVKSAKPKDKPYKLSDEKASIFWSQLPYPSSGASTTDLQVSEGLLPSENGTMWNLGKRGNEETLLAIAERISNYKTAGLAI